MITPEEIKMAEKVGRYYASRWRSVDKEDLIQHLILWICEHQTQLNRWKKEGSEDGKLYVSLKRAANDYCKHETTHAVHQDISANNSYTLEIVKRTLPYVWNTPDVEDPINSKALAIIADVSSALYAMTNDDIALLQLRYGDGLSHDEIASIYKITTDTASQRLHRATERVLSKLGGVAIWDWSDVQGDRLDD
jgi:RNA polymerase sigma factor (sigma-70 family)